MGGTIDAVGPGDMVEVPKGTTVLSTHPRRSRWSLTRTMRVVVAHVAAGGQQRPGEPPGAPAAYWVGSGGYLCCADLRDVRKAAVAVPQPRRWAPPEILASGGTAVRE